MNSHHYIHGRYTDAYVAKMREAFTTVQNTTHWKNPVDAVVDLNAAEMVLLRDAIPFFTGSVPEFTMVPAPERGVIVGRCRYRVQAVGYYIAIGS